MRKDFARPTFWCTMPYQHLIKRLQRLWVKLRFLVPRSRKFRPVSLFTWGEDETLRTVSITKIKTLLCKTNFRPTSSHYDRIRRWWFHLFKFHFPTNRRIELCSFRAVLQNLCQVNVLVHRFFCFVLIIQFFVMHIIRPIASLDMESMLWLRIYSESSSLRVYP